MIFLLEVADHLAIVFNLCIDMGSLYFPNLTGVVKVVTCSASSLQFFYSVIGVDCE